MMQSARNILKGENILSPLPAPDQGSGFWVIKSTVSNQGQCFDAGECLQYFKGHLFCFLCLFYFTLVVS